MRRKISLFIITTQMLFGSFFMAAGGFDIKKNGRNYCFENTHNGGICNANISEVLQQKSPNTNTVTIWITKNWEKEWYDAKTVQKEIIDKGYTPLFIFYWFGDDISPRYVKEHEKEYFQTLKRFSKYLKMINGQKIIVLNPEYNMAGTEKWTGMNQIFLKSFSQLRQDPQVIVGPCVGDFGNYKSINEPKEWNLFQPSLQEAAKKADFIAFQEMRALTRNTKEDILRTAKRAYRFSKYLYEKYKKPTFLAYLAISSYGKNGQKIQAEAFKQFLIYLPKMKKDSKLLGFGIFHYFDYPGHVGYFKKAEEYFGVLTKDGKVKPSFYYYNKLH